MTNKSKIALLAAIAAAGIASAAFAQSGDRTGNPLPYYYDSSGAQVRGAWAPSAPPLIHRPAAQPAPGPDGPGGFAAGRAVLRP